MAAKQEYFKSAQIYVNVFLIKRINTDKLVKFEMCIIRVSTIINNKMTRTITFDICVD